MKRMAIAAVGIALVMGVATACGDGEDKLSVEEYFQKLQTISDDLREREEALGSEFQTAFDPETSPDAAIDTLGRVLGEGASASREVFDDVDSLDPPSEVEDAHNEFLREGRATTRLLETLADRAAEVESLFGLEDVHAELEGPDFEAAGVRLEDACRALEGIAADNGIEVDLDCE
jgi:hypothetical protein